MFLSTSEEVGEISAKYVGWKKSLSLAQVQCLIMSICTYHLPKGEYFKDDWKDKRKKCIDDIRSATRVS